jgi:hypothetical protein
MPTPSNDQPPAAVLLTTAQRDALSDAVAVDELPTSFGVFKPVGHVMLGLPSQLEADALVLALHSAGWPGASVQHFSPRETVPELAALVDNAGAMAGFGYEITMLRRYLALARLGCRWLLVKASDTDQAADVAELARQGGAVLAVHYRTFTVEELIT